MRPSKRTEILDAARRVIAHAGVTAVTFESVAEEAGITKGGVMYHFPSREAMLVALHEHLAAQWEAGLVEAAGKPADQATSRERLAAYARVSTQSATREDLLLMLETVNDPAMNTPWNDVLNRWTAPIPDTGTMSPAELNQIIARLAADGLWLHESLTTTTLPDPIRLQIGEYLAELAYPADTSIQDTPG